MSEPLIFELSRPGRRAFAQAPLDEVAPALVGSGRRGAKA